ncbi:MAG: glycosyltransferase family 9 protein [Kiritimatiellia bacterium]
MLLSTGGLGDVIVFSPVFIAARHALPRAEIILVTASAIARELYAFSPGLDSIEIIDTNRKYEPSLYRKLWQFGLKCRRGGGTTALVCAPRLSRWLTRLFAALCRPQNVMAMAFPPDGISDLEASRTLARRLAPDLSNPVAFAPVTAADATKVRTLLRQKFGVDDPGRLVAVYPSVAKPNRPLWDLRRLLGVAAKIAVVTNGKVVVVGGAEEGHACQAICAERKDILNVAGMLTITETAALMAQARLAICNDGGIMHLAGAVGCPMVAIMPDEKKHYRPPGEYVRVITPSMVTVRAADLESIGEEPVWKAAQELLCATAGRKGYPVILS